MSEMNIIAFYERLAVDEKLRKEAMSLQKQYLEQQDLIDAFIILAGREGFVFSLEEYMSYLLKKAEKV